MMDKDAAIAALAALGQETRLAIFRLLVREAPRGLAAGAIAEQLVTARNTLSAHLKVLDHAGLVCGTREGRTIRYAADMSGLAALLTYLMQDCCNGLPHLCQPAITAALGNAASRFHHAEPQETS